MRRAAILGALGASFLAAGLASAADFGAHWYDGKAELDGYRLTENRYGQPRRGTAVMVFVTEPFRNSTRVKADHPGENPEDVLNVLKLNLIRDFQTGIYDYNTMVSVFCRTDDFAPVKVSFSSAEWCGHVYEERIFNPGKVEGRLFSYFEGQSGPFTLDRPAEGITEDELYLRLRSLRDEFLAPGESLTAPFLPSPFFSRLTHKEPAWSKITITREKDGETVEVPAGTFEARVYTLRTGDGRDGRFEIEEAYPHRIVRWSFGSDTLGELTGSIREPYWSLNGNGGEAYLEKLGLR